MVSLHLNPSDNIFLRIIVVYRYFTLLQLRQCGERQYSQKYKKDCSA